MESDKKTAETPGAEVKPVSPQVIPGKVEPSILTDLKKENVELQAELTKKEELLKKRDELRERESITGRSLAGATEPKPETPKEYKDRIMRGGK